MEIYTDMQLNFITDANDPLLDYIKDDPVRPEISREFRVGTNKFVGTLIDERPLAMICVSLMDRVPHTVSDLHLTAGLVTVAVFYTIWSYAPGAGVDLLRATVARIQEEFPNITRFVTLSPKTEMARRFHIKNGAFVLSENSETVNYEYITKNA
jgi:hypothetical protein